MHFWWSKDINNFLFYGLDIHTVFGNILLAIACVVLAFLFEWIKLIQAKHKQQELIIRAKQIKTICPPKEDATLLPHNTTMQKPLDLSMKNRVLIHVCDASLWLSLHNLGYIIMLMIMSFNLWVFISILIGGGMGYFLFGQRFMKISIENCQVIRDTYCMSTCSRPDEDVFSHEGESTPAAVHASSSGGSTSHHMCHQNVNVSVDIYTSE